MSDREATKDLLARLERHYIKPGPMPGGIFVPECGVNGSGNWGHSRRVDALYVGFTSSSGRILVGHEVKVSRADWRNELDKVGKADAWADECHAWYIVAPSTDIVPVEEVPDGWGLMVINPRTKTRLDVKVKARVRPDHTPSWHAVRSILARWDTLRAQAITAQGDKAADKARADYETRMAQRQTTDLTPEQASRLRMLDKIETAMGVDFGEWYHRSDTDSPECTPEQFAAALRVVKTAENMSLTNDRYATQVLERAADDMLKGLAAFTDAQASLRELTGRAR